LTAAARVLCVSHRLLVQFLADHPEAREAWQRGKGLGRVSLRRLLWKQAQADPAQARFLAKHWLGMNGGQSQQNENDKAVVLTGGERIKLILELQAKVRGSPPDRATEPDGTD